MKYFFTCYMADANENLRDCQLISYFVQKINSLANIIRRKRAQKSRNTFSCNISKVQTWFAVLAVRCRRNYYLTGSFFRSSVFVSLIILTVESKGNL